MAGGALEVASKPDFIAAARAYIRDGFTPIALGPDADGRPKKPLAYQWANLTPHDPRTRKQGWKRATGIGLLCGPHSNNLEVIDIDDEELAEAIFVKFARAHSHVRFVWTVRGRGHIYLRVRVPNERPGPWHGQWEGREVRGELRGRGMQVAAPPTPGYILAREEPPQVVESARKAFDAICLAMGIQPIEGAGGGNYPPAWRDIVREGSRNDSLYVEACKLAAVRMPFERAVELLRLNVELHYEDGERMADKEFRDTVMSAYRRAWPKVAGPAESERYRREFR